jgi:DNA recombination protein RmuC
MNIEPQSFFVGVALGAFLAAVLTSLIAVMRSKQREADLGLAMSRAESRVEAMEELQRSHSEVTQGHKRIEDLVRPLHETIELYQREARDLASLRQQETGQVRETLRNLAQETQQLSRALRSPQARGRWGELTLRRTAELAGLSSHCDFSEQLTLDTAKGNLRPDLVVHLPGQRQIVVDSKVPLNAYLEAMEISDEQQRSTHLAQHARQLKRHVEALASKNYQAQLSSPEFVVLFLPNDGFLSAAVEQEPGIIEFALGRNVVLATPATFYALLVAVAQGWKQEKLSENAEHMCTLGQEMHERLSTFAEHLARVGGALDKSVDHFNSAVGSFTTRVLPQARKLEELGAGSHKSLAAPETIDRKARSQDSPTAS